MTRFAKVSIAVSAAAIGVAALLPVALQSCYYLPRWSGDVEVSPLARESVEACGDGALTTEGSRVVHRHPYLQSVTAESATVVWASWPPDVTVSVTDPEGAEIDVARSRYAGVDGLRARRERRNEQTGVGIHRRPLTAEDFYLLRADIDGLEPGTLYCYQLFAGPTALTEPAPMMTARAPESEQPTRFIAMGDSGTGGAAQAAIARRLSERHFELMLFLGDVAYTSGEPAELQNKFFDVYRDYLRFVPAFPAIGNHERRTRDGRPYFESFVLPDEESYYSFDWGDIHFVAFDTTDPSAEQREWLDDDLASTDRAWTIAYAHHPLFTNSFRGPPVRVRGRLHSIFRRHQVDLVLAGHEHHYERFRPINGVIYVVSGGGGGRLTRIFDRTLAVEQAEVHHFLHFEVTADRLVMKAIDIEGNEIDELLLGGES